MKDKDGWHRDSKGNEHFYAHDAEWADKEIRQKRAAQGSSGGGGGGSSRSSGIDFENRFQFFFSVTGGVCLLEAHELWTDIEKSMKASGYSPVTSDRVGMVAGIALVALFGFLICKTPGYLGKSIVCVLFV